MTNRERVKFRTGDLWDKERAWKAAVKLAETHQKLCAQSIVDEKTRCPQEPNLKRPTQREGSRPRQSGKSR
jgi:hypothetical protein